MSRENAVKEIKRITQIPKEKAFQTIIKNRTSHGGILAAGSGFVKNGEAGKGILSRWYPVTLARRIRDISLVTNKIKFHHGNGFDIIDDYKDYNNVVFFIDPPYTAGGKNAGSRLYTHFQVDHDLLFQKCSDISGDLIMTYDNSQEVWELAKKYEFQAKQISMKNTHNAEMTELVIGKNLSWMSGTDRVLENFYKYGINTQQLL
jgi:DNA adenine methylase